MIKIIYFCGLTGFVKERLLQRYFSSEVRDSSESTLEGLDVLTTVRHHMDDRRRENIMRYMQAIHQRQSCEELQALSVTFVFILDCTLFKFLCLYMQGATISKS
ncbi:hypothetical protein KC19_VG286800 [Ceratodon purpureus]|uniref:Uncharacterized protein n=1 Tax=Ceratodon purpureus TaxID=3225 RepID=A0A8T0HUN3_CERPU|nr:hypothetical protein KC19_VG286800 [Ceratodon purpureus]